MTLGKTHVDDAAHQSSTARLTTWTFRICSTPER